MNNFPIGIFDSGIGGLTVVKEIIKTLPGESLIYLGDTARVPYGTRNKDTINKFAKELTKFLLKQKVKALVVACNTMSAVSLTQIKKLASGIPVIDVISSTVDFVTSQTKTNKIGVIGTVATIKSEAYEKLIKSKNKKITIFSQACPLFVPLVEEGLIKGAAVELIAKDYLLPLGSKNIDCLILGCTHYPLLARVLREIMGEKVKIISSAKPTAKELKRVLENNHLLSSKNAKYRFIVTDAPEKVYKIANLFFGGKFPGRIEKIAL